MWLKGNGKCPNPNCTKQPNVKYKGEGQPSQSDFVAIREHWYIHHMAPGYTIKFQCPHPSCSTTSARLRILRNHIKNTHKDAPVNLYIKEAKEEWYQKVGKEPPFNYDIFCQKYFRMSVTSSVDGKNQDPFFHKQSSTTMTSKSTSSENKNTQTTHTISVVTSKAPSATSENNSCDEKMAMKKSLKRKLSNVTAQAAGDSQELHLNIVQSSNSVTPLGM